MSDFRLTIWGARGSIPVPAAANTRFGSETSCVEVRCGDRAVIFDAGSGILACARRLYAERVQRFDILFTHCHFDHIIGLPFTIPLYKDHVTADIHAGHFQDDTTCRQMVEGFMCPPYFPVTPKQFAADIAYRDFRPPDVLDLGDGIRVRTVRLNHPNGAVGYRLECEGRAVCYITDHEHGDAATDAAIAGLIAGADLMIYDCTYTDEEFPRYRGFGHSTWEEGVRLCRAVGVPRLVIFHHDVSRDDAWLGALCVTARAAFDGAMVGRTGMTIDVGDGCRVTGG